MLLSVICDSKSTIPRSNSSTRSFWSFVAHRPKYVIPEKPRKSNYRSKKIAFIRRECVKNRLVPLANRHWCWDWPVKTWSFALADGPAGWSTHTNPGKNPLRSCIVSNLIHIAITWQKLKYPAQFETSMGSHKTSSAGVSAGAASSIIRSSYHLPEEVLPCWWCCYRVFVWMTMMTINLKMV